MADYKTTETMENNVPVEVEATKDRKQYSGLKIDDMEKAGKIASAFAAVVGTGIAGATFFYNVSMNRKLKYAGLSPVEIYELKQEEKRQKQEVKALKRQENLEKYGNNILRRAFRIEKPKVEEKKKDKPEEGKAE